MPRAWRQASTSTKVSPIAVAQLGVRLDEMTWRDDGSATRVEELQEQVQALAATLAEVGQGLAVQEDAGAPQRLDELGQSLAAVRDEISTLAQSVTPADRIEQIAHRVEELAAEREARQALGARLEEIESRLTADIVTPEHLARALADARDDLPPAPAPLPDPRVDELTRELASLRDGERSSRAYTKLDDLEHRFPAEIVTPAELARRPGTHPRGARLRPLGCPPTRGSMSFRPGSHRYAKSSTVSGTPPHLHGTTPPFVPRSQLSPAGSRSSRRPSHATMLRSSPGSRRSSSASKLPPRPSRWSSSSPSA